MTTFRNIDSVIHGWASQQHHSGKCGNVFFEGPTVYSYGSHFPMARFVGKQSANGAEVVLVTTDSYSVTTSGHLSSVRHAISHCTTFDVADIESRTVKDHRYNVEAMFAEVSRYANKWKRARQNKDWHARTVARLLRQVVDYLKVFNLKPLAAQKPILAKFRQLTFASAGDDRPSERLSNFIGETLLGWTDEQRTKQNAKAEAQRKRAAKAEAQRQAEALSKAKEAIHLWRTGASVPTRDMVAAPVALRLFERTITGPELDRFEVQTSHGATVTAKQFAACYRLWKAGKLSKGDMVGDFRYSHDNGEPGSEVVVIGCHRVPVAEIETISDALKAKHEVAV